MPFPTQYSVLPYSQPTITVFYRNVFQIPENMTIRYHLLFNPVHPPLDFDFDPRSHRPGFSDPLPLLENSASVHTIFPTQSLEEVEITWPVHPHTIAIRIVGAWDNLHEKIMILLGEQEDCNTFLTSHFGVEARGPRALILANGYTTPQLWDMLNLLKTHDFDTGPVPTIQLLASAHITIPTLHTWQAAHPGPLGDPAFYTLYLNWPWMGRLPREMATYFEQLPFQAHRANSVWSRRPFLPHRIQG